MDEREEIRRRSEVMHEARRFWLQPPLGGQAEGVQWDTDRARDLRLRSYTPAEIAGRLGVDVEEVRAFLAAEGLDGRRTRQPRQAEPLADRPAVLVDLVRQGEAAEHLGVTTGTVRRWVTVEHLPYRDRWGRVTAEPYSSRWHRFSVEELDRWGEVRRV